MIDLALIGLLIEGVLQVGAFGGTTWTAVKLAAPIAERLLL